MHTTIESAAGCRRAQGACLLLLLRGRRGGCCCGGERGRIKGSAAEAKPNKTPERGRGSPASPAARSWPEELRGVPVTVASAVGGHGASEGSRIWAP